MPRSVGTASLVAAGLAAVSATSSLKAGEGSAMMPRVKVETSLGDFTLELDGEKAPVSTLNFLQYAGDKFYDGTIFHRVMKTFMVQGGGYLPDLTEKTEGVRGTIKNEWKNGLKNSKYTVAMARKGGQADSATCQFFVNVVDNASLDQPQSDGAAYAVFGKVVEGMETIDKIRDTEVKTDPKLPMGAVVPTTPVVIKSVKVQGTFDKAAMEAGVKKTEAGAKEAEAKVMADKEKETQGTILKLEAEAKTKITKTSSGLMFVDLKVGEGAAPDPTSKVSVHYTGWLLNGEKFDSSLDRLGKDGKPAPFTFSLSGGVIKGWLEGVATMKVGGKRKLLIPSELAYGKRGSPPKIGADAWLLFEVELLSIEGK